MRTILAFCFIALLAGCEPLPFGVVGLTRTTTTDLNVFPIPSCVFICTSHLSAIREDVNSTGTGAVTTGAKSSEQTASNTGGTRN